MGQQNWRTPEWLFQMLSERFGPFELDAAANKKNALCAEYFDGKANGNGLTWPWVDRTFCNPPFKQATDWVRKAWLEWNERGTRSVLVLPVGCSQAWWHLYVLGCPEACVYWSNRRISFRRPDGTPTRGADRDTVIVAYGYGPQAFRALPAREWAKSTESTSARGVEAPSTRTTPRRPGVEQPATNVN